MIRRLAQLKGGQPIRSDGPQTHFSKAGTPTMGGALILLAVAGLGAAVGRPAQPLRLAGAGVMLAFGAIGWYDDWLKIVKRDPNGLKSRWKYLLQSLFGLAAGAVPLLHRRRAGGDHASTCRSSRRSRCRWRRQLRRASPTSWIVGFSNAVNLTDGLDGLAIMPTVLVGVRARRVRVRDGQRGVLRVPADPADARRRRAGDLLRGDRRRGPRASCGSTPIRRRCSWATSARSRSARRSARSR